MMHHLSHIAVSIQRMGSADNFTTDVLEQLHIRNFQETYESTNKVNDI
jgi:hypothetical protein